MRVRLSLLVLVVASACGTNGNILSGVDGGADLAATDASISTDLLLTSPDLAGSDLASSDLVVVAGDGGTPLWQLQASPTTSDLNAVWGVSPLHGTGAPFAFAVGKGEAIVGWNGTAWSSVPHNPLPIDLYAVWGRSVSDVLAGGVYSGEGSLIRWNGSTWASRTVVGAFNLRGMWGDGTSHVFIVSDGGAFLHSSNGGTSFSSTPSSLGYYAVWGTSATNVYIVGQGFIGRSTDGTFVIQQMSLGAAKLYGVWGSSGSDIYAVGESGPGPGVIYHSSDGTTWAAQTVPVGTNRLTGVWGSAANDVYAVGADGVVLHSTGGGTWIRQATPTTKRLNAVWGNQSGEVFAVGDAGTILYQANFGARVSCVALSCDRGAGEHCCATSPGSATCQTGACPMNTTTAACDGPEDCGGTMCCGTSGDVTYQSSCEPSCSQSTFCHTTADCPTATPYCCPGLSYSVRTCLATQTGNCT